MPGGMLSNRLSPLQVQVGDGADGAPGTPTSLGGAKLRHQAHHLFADNLELPRPATASSPRRAKRRLRSHRFWLILEGLARRPGTKRRLATAFCLALLFGAFFLDLEYPHTVFFQSSHAAAVKKLDHDTALAGMGHLWGRGNRPVSELIIAHVSAACQPESLRLFLRSVKHSGAQDRADLVLLMSPDAELERVAAEEEESFQRVKAGLSENWLKETEIMRIEAGRARALLEQETGLETRKEGATEGEATRAAEGEVAQNGGRLAGEEKTPDLDPESKSGAKLNELANSADTTSTTTVDEGTIQRAAQTGSSLKDGASIRVIQAVPVQIPPVAAAPLVIPNLDEDLRSYVWGEDNRTAMAEHLEDFLSPESPSWGATASFSMDELDLLGGLEGFMEPVPEGLRRWVCYQTLLGRLRHRYKHVFLTEVDNTVVLGDALGAVRVKNGLYITSSDLPWKTTDPSDPEGKSIMNGTYGNRWWQALDSNEHITPLIDDGAVLGSMKAVRALTDAVVNEAVRVALQRRDRMPLSDQALLSNLVYKSALMQDRKFEPVQLVSNRDSVVHSMAGSLFLSQAFTNVVGDDYAVLHRFDPRVPVIDQQNITSLLRARLCKDDSKVWRHQDCS